MSEKHHWKKIVSDPNYIGEADFEEGEEKVLTISHINSAEIVKTAEGSSKKAVVHWRESGNKPMILNVARSKAIEKVAGSPYFEDWPGAQLQLYIDDHVKAFGEIVAAVRVRPFKPRIQRQEPIPQCTDCGVEIAPAFGRDARWVAGYTAKNYGCPLCAECAQKRKEAAEAAKVSDESEAQTEQVEETEVL